MREQISPIQVEDRDHLYDHCGVVAVQSSKDLYLFNFGLSALTKLQTRGYDGAGYVALRSDGRILMYKKEGTIEEVFSPNVVRLQEQSSFYHAQYQTRYGTAGDFSENNVQPFITRHRVTGEIFVVSHNGQFSRGKEELIGQSDTALFVERLANSEGCNWDEKIINTLAHESGAWSLIIGTKDCMYLARDPIGIRPLYFSQKEEDGNIITMAASETSALDAAGFKQYGYSEVLPNQIIRFNKNESRYSIIQNTVDGSVEANCIFENAYTEDPQSRALLPRKTNQEINNSPTIATIRRRYGKELAKESPLTTNEVDLVIGIPGTGIIGGRAYAKALGIPYEQAITDKKTEGVEQRTFMQSDIGTILKKVIKHFNFNAKLLDGKKVCLVDDTLVRGNISTGLTRLLKESYGVKEVHFRILFPPIDKTCFLGTNTRSANELIAANHLRTSTNYDELVEKIRKEIGADSLAYLSSAGLLNATNGRTDAKGFCMGCILGHQHPIDEYGNKHHN